MTNDKLYSPEGNTLNLGKLQRPTYPPYAAPTENGQVKLEFVTVNIEEARAIEAARKILPDEAIALFSEQAHKFHHRIWHGDAMKLNDMDPLKLRLAVMDGYRHLNESYRHVDVPSRTSMIDTSIDNDDLPV